MTTVQALLYKCKCRQVVRVHVRQGEVQMAAKRNKILKILLVVRLYSQWPVFIVQHFEAVSTSLVRVEFFCCIDFVRLIGGTGDQLAKCLKRGLLRLSGKCLNLFSMTSASSAPCSQESYRRLLRRPFCHASHLKSSFIRTTS